MYRLGLRLTLQGGREALVRLLLTAFAVAVGVTVLLAVFADYNGFEKTSNRQCWECTQAAPGHPSPASSELWDYSENIYKGRFIEQLDVAALGRGAPVVPGIPRLPSAGQFYASPALASLLRTVPADQLADRFPGHLVGLIGDKALSGPTALVAIIGYSPTSLAKLAGTITVDHIATAPEIEGTTRIYQMGFGIGAIAVLFPLLILINTATRLAASRREERYAAMRLVGGTPRQINLIASVDAIVSALAGALVGIALFQAVQPALADISFNGQRFFNQYVTPTALGYLVMLVGVPLASAAGSLWSLQRVRISPLGVSRRTSKRAPTGWRALPLVIGIPLFVYGVSREGAGHNTNALVFIGFALIMIGLVVAGTWLTMQGSRLLARLARGASSLLAARRLADNPKSSFRTVSGLVLAVFVGTAIATVGPVFNKAESNLGGAHSLANVLRAPFNGTAGPGLAPSMTSRLLAQLHGYPGVTVLPIYVNMANFTANNTGPGNGQGASTPPPPPPPAPLGKARRTVHRSAVPPPLRRYRPSSRRALGAQYDSIVSCASIKAFPALGSCRPGLSYVYANLGDMLFTDNPLFVSKNLPAVTSHSPVAPSTTQTMYLAAVLLRAPDTTTMEKVRTYLTNYDLTLSTRGLKASGGADISAWQMGDLEPETFGETAEIRNADINNVEAVVFAIMGLTLLVAACSLAVTVAGGIIERKRAFTLLRVSGTASSTLARVVLLESALPLFVVAVVAALVAIGITTPVINALPLHIGTGGLHLPGAPYYGALGAGFAIALAVVALTLPILGRVTGPEKVRFE